MRIEKSVTSVSWIPSEAMTGPLRVPIDLGIGHYDEPLPDHIDDLEEWRKADRFRFANELRAWIDVDDGRVVDAGYSGGGHIGATTLALGLGHVTIPAVSYPDIRREPEVSGASATFVQTSGGRTGAPLPHTLSRPPFVHIKAPTVWTTLSLTISADGSSTFELIGASKMPRHFVYDDAGDLVAKSAAIDFHGWTHEDYGEHTPWESHDEQVVTTTAESSLERQLSAEIMQDGKHHKRLELAEGDTLVEQGDAGWDLFLLLDGILTIEIDGEVAAEVGPGSILGERSLFEGGQRTATLRAATPVRLATVAVEDVRPSALAALAARHGREDKGDD